MVQRSDKVHLGRARIGEAGCHTMVGQRGDQRFSARHGLNRRVGHGVSFLSCLLPVFSLSASRINV
jgi:hypothetical protein